MCPRKASLGKAGSEGQKSCEVQRSPYGAEASGRGSRFRKRNERLRSFTCDFVTRTIGVIAQEILGNILMTEVRNYWEDGVALLPVTIGEILMTNKWEDLDD